MRLINTSEVVNVSRHRFVGAAVADAASRASSKSRSPANAEGDKRSRADLAATHRWPIRQVDASILSVGYPETGTGVGSPFLWTDGPMMQWT